MRDHNEQFPIRAALQEKNAKITELQEKKHLIRQQNEIKKVEISFCFGLASLIGSSFFSLDRQRKSFGMPLKSYFGDQGFFFGAQILKADGSNQKTD